MRGAERGAGCRGEVMLRKRGTGGEAVDRRRERSEECGSGGGREGDGRGKLQGIEGMLKRAGGGK